MTDKELRDAAVAHLKKTTVGYVNKHWKTPPAGSEWEQALTQLDQIGQAAPPPPPPPPPADIPPWPVGSLLPARLAVSSGSVIAVSTDAAFRSALSTVNPGQIIRLEGTRFGLGKARYDVSRSGTSAAPITIEGQAGTVFDTALKVTGSFIRIRSLEVDGTSRSAENGIEGSGSHDVEVCGVYIHDVTRGGLYAQGIYTSGTCARWHILNTRAERCGALSDANPELEHGMYLSGTDFLVCNVVLRDNSGFGIQLYSNLQNSIITHITSVGAKIHAGLVQDGSSTNNRVHNSIAIDNSTYGFTRRQGVITASHLIAHGNGGTDFNSMSGTGLLSTDPLLSAALRPQPGSPALGHSDPRYSPGFDLAGQTRGVTPTAGAYES